MISITRRQRLLLALVLRQGGDYTGKLHRRPLDWPEIRAGLIGFAIIALSAYGALWMLSIIGELLP